MIRSALKLALILLGVALVPLSASPAFCQAHPMNLDQALYFALAKGDMDGLSAVRDKGADVHATMASADLDAEELFGPRVAELIKTKADYDSWPSLTWAVFLQMEDAVRVLIKSGAHVNALDTDRTSALHWAAWTGNYPITRFLMENGANPNLADKLGRKPLDWALMTGQKDIIRILPGNVAIQDSDRDGVADGRDQCPNTPYGAAVDNRGCWVAAYANYFDFNKAVVKPQYHAHIQRAAQVLQASPEIQVVVVGHTDNVGNDGYNQELGLRRAQAVADLLVKFGVNRERFTVESKGEIQPIDSNATAAGRSVNRRVEIHVREAQAASQ